MQLQVLVAEIREDGDVVGDLGDAGQGQTVRSRLYDRSGVPGGNHRPKGLLQLRRLWRGDVLWVLRPNRAHLHCRGADQPSR